jgi:hypothetical protein
MSVQTLLNPLTFLNSGRFAHRRSFVLNRTMPQPPPALHHDDQPSTISRNQRNGLILFSIYLALYAGFMLLSAFKPQVMATRPFGGVNLAILYGLGLIVSALLLAAIYMYLSRPPTRS